MLGACCFHADEVSECARENQAGAALCLFCGTAFGVPCTACTHTNPPGARFCNRCGKELELLPAAGDVSRTQG
jgi:adenylate cyclase